MLLVHPTKRVVEPLQKNVYMVAVKIWRLLKTVTIYGIIRHFRKRHNVPSKCGI